MAVGLAPTGSADPFGLRRAILGVLRTMFDHELDLSITDVARAAFQGFAGTKLDLDEAALLDKVADFTADRLRGLLSEKYPADVVRAALGSGSDRPLDVLRRVKALAELAPAARAEVGEVFKRATNIAGQAPAGTPSAPAAEAHASEKALFEAYGRFEQRADVLVKEGNYAEMLREVAAIAPVMRQYFIDVLVIADDLALRENRLKLMRSISERCTRVARLELLANS
jgi:glycyl-tRNA synthetase beta chain